MAEGPFKWTIPDSTPPHGPQTYGLFALLAQGGHSIHLSSMDIPCLAVLLILSLQCHVGAGPSTEMHRLILPHVSL